MSPDRLTHASSRRRISGCAALAIILCIVAQSSATAQTEQTFGSSSSPLQLLIEAQRVDTLVNSVRKGDHYAGSEFDTTPYTGHTSSEVRFTLFYALSGLIPGDELRLVAAPFIASGSAPLAGTLIYDGATFTPGEPLSVFFKFNTYRVTYDAPVWKGGRGHTFIVRLGGTLALRDAQVTLGQPGLIREYKNLGPVPLLYASVAGRLSEHMTASMEFDAFPAPGGGGLFDGSALLAGRISAGGSVFAGVRGQAGGASEAYFYSHLVQVSGIAGISYRF
jgi:hypothetical protein